MPLSSPLVRRLRSRVSSLQPDLLRWPFTLRLTPLLLLAWLLATWQLGASDLGLDEAISHWIARKPLLEVLQYTMQQSREHPPLYYLFLHLWMRLAGDSEFALRVFSGFGGLVGIASVVTLARRWFTKGTAVLAALMLATAPMWVLHARDARMYSWLIALALLNVYGLDRGLHRDRWADWALFFVSLLLMLGTHYFSGLLLIGYGGYLIVRWRHLPQPGRSRLALLLAGLTLLGGAWIIGQPGPRGSLLETAAFTLRAQRSLYRLGSLLGQWALGAAAFTLPVGLIWLLGLPVWLLAVLGIITADKTPKKHVGLTWLLVLLIPVPILTGFGILPAIQARHVMATFGLFALALAVGIGRLGQHRKRLAALTFVALLSLNLTLAFQLITTVGRPFSAPLRYISERARSDEPVAYTYFFDWPQDSYYNRRYLPARFLLTTDDLISSEEADVRAKAALADTPSLWLVLYPGPENTDLLEQAFNKLAFPTSRVWFPGDRGVVHYFSALPLQERTTDMAWENGIALKQWWASGDSVAAGDALRLQFEWQPVKELTQEALLVLKLVGPDRTTWVEQVWTPCNGRCPTTEWPEGAVMDHMALYVPPDMPPGTYELRIGWLNPAGSPSLGQLGPATVKQNELPLTEVNILMAAHSFEETPAPPLLHRMNAPLRPGLTLKGVDFVESGLRSGARLPMAMQLAVSTPQPELTAQLLLEGRGEQHRLNTALAPAWYPSTTWMPDRVVRVQPQFQVPGTIQPGRYRVSLGVLAPGADTPETVIHVGSLRVEDRPRRFDVPEVGIAVGAACDEGIRLARFTFPATALPGGQVALTLIWQAGGPTSRNWKVFAHLVDANGVVWSQADAYPGAGLALTPSWRRGEVIVDEHRFDLPADLPAGSYRIRLGFYDEPTGERLRCGDGDSIILPDALEVTLP
ncbi:MAG: glycosyltransferase family 39 protein [Anaerolineae bacterium]|nr:glycosyltransferase family 39 protein [Anaerolineae bacterium]